MKNKTVILVLIVVIIVAAILIGYRFLPKNNQAGGNNQPTNGQSQNKLVTDYFEISLPAGWQQATPPVGASAMAVSNEEITDAAAQKINFKTYVAVSYDTLQGKSLSEYLQSIENQLKQAIPDVVFSQEHDAVINNRTARAIEADLTQQGVNFKLLMVAVKGNGDDVWVMSFNTLQSSWMAHQETFSDIANSFKLKK